MESSPNPPLATAGIDGLLAEMRPELHRYCARMVGSVIDGEDVLQDALIKAVEAFASAAAIGNPEGWLFRIAHNTALDFLKRHGTKYTEARDDLDDAIGFEDRADPAVVRAALSRFLVLPVSQRGTGGYGSTGGADRLGGTL